LSAMPSDVLGAASAPEPPDEQAVLDMLVPRAQARIDAQLRDNDALDAKAFGVLGVAGAVITLLVAAHNDIHRLWWLPAIGLGVAGVLMLAAVWPRTFDVGPDTRDFYEKMATSTRLDASRQMLTELLVAVDANDRQLPSKRRLFKAGFGVLVVALLTALPIALRG
jgi:hypothetical protein